MQCGRARCSQIGFSAQQEKFTDDVSVKTLVRGEFRKDRSDFYTVISGLLRVLQILQSKLLGQTPIYAESLAQAL